MKQKWKQYKENLEAIAEGTYCSARLIHTMPTTIQDIKRAETSLQKNKRTTQAEKRKEELALGTFGIFSVAQIIGYIGAGITYPEILLFPAATNTLSGTYELGGKKAISKIKSRWKRMKTQQQIKKINKSQTSETAEDKLTLKERIIGKYQRNINVKPEITLSPSINVYVNDERQRDVKVEIEDAKRKKEEEISLDNYLIKDEPFYMSLDGELELFANAYKHKLPVMLKGPTGCGKTRFVEHMAYHLGKPLITVSCQEDLSASDLTGRILLNQEGTYWQDGPLTTAVRHGAICYLDEVVEARNEVMVLIHALTDHRRMLTVEKTGETIKAHEDFMLAVSYNPHYQSALKEMKQSTRQRFIGMDFTYPDPSTETAIVEKESGVNYKTAEKLVTFGKAVRDMKSKGLAEGASTRLLIYGGKLIKAGVPEYSAVVNSIVSPITDEPDLHASLTDYAKSYFKN